MSWARGLFKSSRSRSGGSNSGWKLPGRSQSTFAAPYRASPTRTRRAEPARSASVQDEPQDEWTSQDEQAAGQATRAGRGDGARTALVPADSRREKSKRFASARSQREDQSQDEWCWEDQAQTQVDACATDLEQRESRAAAQSQIWDDSGWGGSGQVKQSEDEESESEESESEGRGQTRRSDSKQDEEDEATTKLSWAEQQRLKKKKDKKKKKRDWSSSDPEPFKLNHSGDGRQHLAVIIRKPDRANSTESKPKKTQPQEDEPDKPSWPTGSSSHAKSKHRPKRHLADSASAAVVMSGVQETTFTVRTDTDNDAMAVPEGIETVVVNDNAERVIVPPGVQIIRLQTPKAGGGGHRSRSRSGSKGSRGRSRSRSRSPRRKSRSRSRSPSMDYGDMIDELVRAKRSEAVQTGPTAVSEGVQTVPRHPAAAEKSLSLPSIPATPPGMHSMGTDTPDFRPAAKLPPLAMRVAPVAATGPRVTSSEAAPKPAERTPPTATHTPPASNEEPPPPLEAPKAVPENDIFSDKTLEVDKKRVISQQPSERVGNGKLVRYAGETEAEMRDPLMGRAKMRHVDSFGWREEFESGEADQKKPFIQKLGRAMADILCCWLGL